MNDISYIDFKKLNEKDLHKVVKLIREKILSIASNKQIHLSSNLGIVEISTALLYLYDSPKDKILYDTGHQCYAHKMITDRFNTIDSVRDFEGISGFLEPNESQHDFISGGHSGNMLSIGQAIVDSSVHKNVVVVVGDASLSNGTNLEALTDIAKKQTKMLIIINDNYMSISENYNDPLLNELRDKNIENYLKKIDMYSSTNSIYRKLYESKNPSVKYFIKNFINFKNQATNWMFNKNIFENMGFKYIGIVDGNDIRKTLDAIKRAKFLTNFGPVILHFNTIKGYGNVLAQKDRVGDYHSVNITIGKQEENSYGQLAASWFDKLLSGNPDYPVKIINPSMTYSTGFLEFKNKYRKNYDDMGIVEEHCVSKAAGYCLCGIKPVVVMYSTFLQRVYDQIHNDLSRLNLPALFLIDRCDISYRDGNTHHGIYDMAFLKTIPNAIVANVSNNVILNRLLEIGTLNDKYPFFIRYSKNEPKIKKAQYFFENGDWIFEKKQEFQPISLIISYGDIINDVVEQVEVNKIDCDVINAVFTKGYNAKKVVSLLKKYQKVYIIEKVYYENNLYNDIVKICFENKININVYSHCIQTNEIGFGNKNDVNRKINLDVSKIISNLKNNQ